MSTAPGWLPVFVAIGAALAAATSAWFSRKSFDRNHWPYVWPEWRLARVEEEDYDEEDLADEDVDDEAYERLKQKRFKIQLRLRNDGPGLALDVMWSIERPYQPWRLRIWKLRSLEPLKRRRTLQAINKSFTAMTRDAGGRALRSGSVLEDRQGRPFESYAGHYMKDDGWSIVVRYSDVAGRRWEYRERAFSDRELSRPPRRVRRRLRREKLADDRYRWRFGWDW